MEIIVPPFEITVSNKEQALAIQELLERCIKTADVELQYLAQCKYSSASDAIHTHMTRGYAYFVLKRICGVVSENIGAVLNSDVEEDDDVQP
jgi:hypothetical protein